MKKKYNKKLRKFKLTAVDKQKRELELSFEQRALRKELREEDRSKVNATKIRRITIDSVYDKTHYRLLVAEFKTGVPLGDILHTKSWETEYSILIDGKKKIYEKKDSLLESFFLEEDEIHEGRVFLLSDGYKSEITEYAKEDAQDAYENILYGKRRRK